MLEIKQFTFGPFATNTYVVSIPALSAQRSASASGLSGEAGLRSPTEAGLTLLIDPACSNEYERQELLNYISSLCSLSPQDGLCSISASGLSILATHAHLDHLWGAKWACEQWHTSVLIHPDDIPLANAMQQQYDLFGISRKVEPFDMQSIFNFQFSIFNFQVLSTPGHTPGSVCLYFPEDKVLFSGDTLFRMGYGRTDLPGGDFNQLINSLQRLFRLPSDTRVFPGHGDPTTIACEARHY